MDKICILGMGYIGLPTAVMFASHGKQVVGVDVNESVIETLNNGGIHIEEPGLKEEVGKVLLDRRLSVKSHPEQASAFIIAVPTPFLHDQYGEFEGRRYKLADMHFVRSATESIVPYLKRGDLVILESTSPPGTTEKLVKPILESTGLTAGKDFYLAYSPERVLPGKIMQELIQNDRVIGGIDRVSSEIARDLYACFVRGEIVLTDPTTAEFVKIIENTFRDVNIAIANEFSRLADFLGIDVWEAIGLANRHPRVNILNPGPGVGGHCISVDPWFLVEAAPQKAQLVRTAREINDAQPAYIVNILESALGDLRGKKFAVMGLAYKPNVDDLRESPAIEIVHLLVEKGSYVVVFEPHNLNTSIANCERAPDFESAVKDAEVVVFLVGHREFKDLTPDRLTANSRASHVFDMANVLEPDVWESCGVDIYRLGTPKNSNQSSKAEAAGASQTSYTPFGKVI